MNEFLQYIPLNVQKLVLLLLLSFLIGFEREEHKTSDKFMYLFGGVRTYPLIGFCGFVLAYITNSDPLALTIGLAVIGSFLWISFKHSLEVSKTAGITSEVSAILTFLLGPLIYQEHFWIAVSLGVISVFLLEFKEGLEGVAKKVSSVEILTFAKFLLLSVVILPTLPDVELTRFHINPFSTWVIVVAISSLSYGSYILQNIFGKKRGLFFSAILGGAYSSTFTTITLAKHSHFDKRSHIFSGPILASSGMMYLRISLLLFLFSPIIFNSLYKYTVSLGIIAVLFGFIWSKTGKNHLNETSALNAMKKNPLEISSSLFFAVLYLAILMATEFILNNYGKPGIFSLAILSGVVDVDPFLMSMAHSAGQHTPINMAQNSILIVASSNNVMKAIYSLIFSNSATKKQSFIFLVALSILGLIPILFL